MTFSAPSPRSRRREEADALRFRLVASVLAKNPPPHVGGYDAP
jgi:hypothetical protein